MRKVFYFLAALIVASTFVSCSKAEPERKKSLKEIDDENQEWIRKRQQERQKQLEEHPEFPLEQFPLEPNRY